ncbi:hypothetical protein AKJ09_05686 [Labilithrix luteola]|uniref:Outer membrane protein beta-barrel domain-containing protein n=1 Tax=Labilithrix luteola TaxID=1391654 RepID=A0A0K1PZV2_9BACT|nr:outer membrane beta-barrel protein [Labilithrix luteola]AKU99022.1 hypothetical protein AKJ09_05686 [Labilithrix luteola]
MRKIVTFALAFGSLLFASSAFAQGAPPAGAAPGVAANPTSADAPAKTDDGDDGKKIGLGGDLLFLIPTGDLADATGPQIGPLFRAGYRVIPALEVTGRIGYLFAFSKSVGQVDSSVTTVPIWAGARYFFMEPKAGLYAGAEVGLNIITGHVSGGGVSVSSDSQTRFGANIGAGYVISKELPIDIRAQLTMYNLLGKEDGEKTYLGVGLGAGYTFQL